MGPQSGFPKTYPNTEKISGPVMSRRASAADTDHTRTRKAMAATADTVITPKPAACRESCQRRPQVVDASMVATESPVIVLSG